MFDGRMDGPSGRGRADGAARGGPDARRDAPDLRLARVLREARAERFASGFADRVMREVRSAGATGTRECGARPGGTRESGIESGTRASGFASALMTQFLRLAPLAATLIAGLFVYNVWIAGSGRPTLDDALGLRPVTFGEAYSLEALLLEGAPAEGPQ